MRRSLFLNSLFVGLLVLMALPFALYAIERGTALGSAAEQASSRFIATDAPLSTFAIYAHMVTGGLIAILAPLQLLSLVRRRWPVVHRLSGYVVTTAAFVTGAAGLVYVALRGTIGGAVMDVGFGLYGVLMVVSALQTVRLARVRDPRHRLWAERLVILALASWLYRVHYGIWEIATDGAGSNAEFTGPFDIIQVFAFYLPYLLLHHWIWQRRPQNVRQRLS